MLPYMAKRIKMAAGIKAAIQLCLKEGDSGWSDNLWPNIIKMSFTVQGEVRRGGQADSSMKKAWPNMLTLKTEEESAQPRYVGTV